jgi:hypothetical protein
MLIREDRSGTKHDLGTVWGCFYYLLRLTSVPDGVVHVTMTMYSIAYGLFTEFS